MILICPIILRQDKTVSVLVFIIGRVPFFESLISLSFLPSSSREIYFFCHPLLWFAFSYQYGVLLCQVSSPHLLQQRLLFHFIKDQHAQEPTEAYSIFFFFFSTVDYSFNFSSHWRDLCPWFQDSRVLWESKMTVASIILVKEVLIAYISTMKVDA